MKKLIIVLGILTQSCYSNSQTVELFHHSKVKGKNSFMNNIISLENVNGELYGLYWGYNQTNGNSRPFTIIKMDKNTLDFKKQINLNLPTRPLMEGEIRFWENRKPGRDYGKPTKSHFYISGLTFDGRYFYLGDPTTETLLKIDKTTGKHLGSIKAPPLPSLNHHYSFIEYYGGYFWVMVDGQDGINRYGHKPTLYKISKSGKIIKKFTLPDTNYYGGICIKNNGEVWIYGTFKLNPNTPQSDCYIDKTTKEKFGYGISLLSQKTEKFTKSHFYDYKRVTLKNKLSIGKGLTIIGNKFYTCEMPQGYEYKFGDDEMLIFEVKR